ncbi:MAG: hypothetical protein KAS51_06905, partial [Candidatus Omnitrophica bacterium]|nr:hypothetical protein [Candidatus Omnitrophota bacterium]
VYISLNEVKPILIFRLTIRSSIFSSFYSFSSLHYVDTSLRLYILSFSLNPSRIFSQRLVHCLQLARAFG